MKIYNINDTLIRTIKTMFQALVSYLAAQLMLGIDITNEVALRSLLIGGIGALLGALSNIHLTPQTTVKEDDDLGGEEICK